MSGPEKIVFLEAFGGKEMSLERAEKIWPMFSRDERRRTHKVYDTLINEATPEKVRELKKFSVEFNQSHKSKCFRCGTKIPEDHDVCESCNPENLGGNRP